MSCDFLYHSSDYLRELKHHYRDEAFIDSHSVRSESWYILKTTGRKF